MGHQGRSMRVVLLGLLSVPLTACQYITRGLFPDELAPPIDVTTASLSPIVSDPNPGNRWAPGLAYDTSRGTIMLYGGGRYYGPWSESADMWEMDGNTWHLVCDPCPPGSRFAPVFVYDSNRQRFILFGGSTTNLDSDVVGSLWTYDADGWKASNLPGPGPRWGSAHAFDKDRDALVLYGGATADGFAISEHWELHGDTWLPVDKQLLSPEIRAFAGGTYVAATQSFVLYGGSSDGYSQMLDDLWSWNGSTWKQLCNGCTGRARFKSPIVAVRGGGILQFGGYDGSNEVAGTRYFTGTTLKLLLDTPTPRDSMGAVFDPERSRVLVVGGNGDGCGGDCSEVFQVTFN